MDQFRDGNLGFHVKTERGIPVCSRADWNPVKGLRGGLDDDGIGPGVGPGGGAGGPGAGVG
jgi:hypothetical protein